MLNNGMTPQNGLFLDENGEIFSLVGLLKGINIGVGGAGKQIELQKGDTHIQWKYTDEEEWKGLIAIAELKGAKGDKGATGEKGADGFGTQEQYNDIISRLEALENK